MQFPRKLRNSRKGLVNIENKNKECLRGCQIRHLNPMT